MPVIGPFGVLGQVSRTVSHQSEVTLISDHKSRISVINNRTGQIFLLAGTGDSGLLTVAFAQPSADLQPGDELVTSGLDHLYPKAVLTAIVKKFDVCTWGSLSSCRSYGRCGSNRCAIRYCCSCQPTPNGRTRHQRRQTSKSL